jgi:hypothetical protein
LSEFDPEFWKKKYASEWKRGKDRVRYVREQLESGFPQLIIKKGFLAERSNYVKTSPKEKHEPNLMLYLGKSIVCDIEVSGTYKEVKPPEDIWILQGKFVHAMNLRKDRETWFYMVYPNYEYVLSLDLIERFKDNTEVFELKAGALETYIKVPCEEAYQKAVLFGWIDKRIKQIK